MPPNSEKSSTMEQDVQNTNNASTSSTINGKTNTNENKFIVKYRKNYYDITEFLHKHPGGLNTLKGLENTDMTSRFMKAPPHSDAAMYLMREYQMEKAGDVVQNGKINNSNNKINNNNNNNEILNNIKENIEILEETDDEMKSAYSSNNNNTDESMEHLVDWSKAMIPQIAAITEHYNEWVHKPVDRPLRLFGPSYLEMCTKTPWWVVPTFWIPVITTILYNEYYYNEFVQTSDRPKLSLFGMYFIFGVLLWTLLEYVLHRYVFHMEVTEKTPTWLCTFHFMIHGLHHKVPFDPMRLVFPPVPGVILAVVLYTPISLLLPQPRILLGGALFGYLCYDMIHYYLHYGSPAENPIMKHLYHMKRYHYQHHFAHQDLGYGISTPLWDFVFNTRIHLRKLRFHLKWK